MDKNPRGNSFLLDAVFKTPEALIEAVAKHHAIINAGQDHLLDDAHSIGEAWQQNLENHAEAMGEKEGVRGCEREQKHWVKESKKQVKLVVKAGMPLTIRSAESFWPIPKK